MVLQAVGFSRAINTFAHPFNSTRDCPGGMSVGSLRIQLFAECGILLWASLHSSYGWKKNRRANSLLRSPSFRDRTGNPRSEGKGEQFLRLPAIREEANWPR